MDTRKFEYLETIRQTIELGDYDELKDYLDDIRDTVRPDPDFQEIFMEISTGNYRDVISLIDDIIYKEMQSEFISFEEEEEAEDEKPGDNSTEFNLDIDFDEELKEEIYFEPFDDDGYVDKAEDDSF